MTMLERTSVLSGAVDTHSLIRATEVWAPVPDRHELELVGSQYGDVHLAGDLGLAGRIAYGRGLPGVAWRDRRPVVMRTDDPAFGRPTLARVAGLTCAIAIPVFDNDVLTAVLVLMCGDSDGRGGAIELWHRADGGSGRNELSLQDGCYGALHDFEHVSRWATFRRGVGLPGLVWATGMPILMNDIGSGGRFLRSVEADRCGITTGLGVPVGCDPDAPHVLTFLSTSASPIARVVEIWAVEASGRPERQAAHPASGVEPLSSDDTGHAPQRSDLVDAVLADGIPAVTSSVTGEMAVALHCHAEVAIPVTSPSGGRAVVVLAY